MLSKMPSCISRQHPKRFENQTNTCPRKWVNSKRGDLLVLELDQPMVDLGGIHVLYPPDRRPPAKVRVMIDYLARAFERVPP